MHCPRAAPARHPCRLLRHEVGEVANRRAWADPAAICPDLLALYRRPLRAQGWDVGLVEVSATLVDMALAACGAGHGAVTSRPRRQQAGWAGW